jgi:hypothetical protein
MLLQKYKNTGFKKDKFEMTLNYNVIVYNFLPLSRKGTKFRHGFFSHYGEKRRSNLLLGIPNLNEEIFIISPISLIYVSYCKS